MSFKAVAWALLAVVALATVVLFNYWASWQPLSTLVYAGFVLALCGLANAILPFRFLGIRRRATGLLILAGGAGLAAVALFWPAATVRVAGGGSRLDQIMPEYQFHEVHSVRVHAGRERAMAAVKEATFEDMTSLVTLMKIRGAVIRHPAEGLEKMQAKRIMESFGESGYIAAGRDGEMGMYGAFNYVKQKPAGLKTVEEFAAYREAGAVKMAFDFVVEDAGGGWSRVTTETRVMVHGMTRGMASYWRLIVPGSGLLRLEWLEGIKRRAEERG